jgi:hypothetical protein
LKNRLNINQPLQVFGTSASLPSGIDSDEKIISFAKDLFGEEVHRVIRGTRIPHVRLQQKQDNVFSLDANSWCCIGHILNTMLEDEFLEPHEWSYLLDGKGFSFGIGFSNAVIQLLIARLG